MQQNILNSGRVAKIFLLFVLPDGTKKKESVVLRYMRDKDFYFSGELFINFAKPKVKSPVEVRVYTPDGLYKATVRVIDVTLSMNEVLYHLELPKTWDFVQMRVGSRKNVELPGVLEFSDGEKLSFETYDLSVGGFSFYTDKPVLSIYQRFECNVSLDLPDYLLANFPDHKFNTRVKFARYKEDPSSTLGRYFYGLKFTRLYDNDKIVLKNYILGLQ